MNRHDPDECLFETDSLSRARAFTRLGKPYPTAVSVPEPHASPEPRVSLVIEKESLCCESGSLRSCLEPVCRLEALRQSLAHGEDLA